MIAIDTNVLLRYLLNDDKAQSPKAYRLITGASSVLITDVVLAETIWTLTGKRYKLGKSDIIRVINALFADSNIVFEDSQTIWRALQDYQKELVKEGGKRKEPEFQDALVVNKAIFSARQNQEALEGIYTFDAAAQRLPGTRAP